MDIQIYPLSLYIYIIYISLNIYLYILYQNILYMSYVYVCVNTYTHISLYILKLKYTDGVSVVAQ